MKTTQSKKAADEELECDYEIVAACLLQCFENCRAGFSPACSAYLQYFEGYVQVLRSAQ